MLTYFDTSVLIKSFVLEPRSEEAVALIESTDTGIPISHFSSIEFTNALQLKIFRDQISLDAASRYLAAFEADVKSGHIYYPPHDIRSIFKSAQKLSRNFTRDIGSRSLDILHVASALEFGCDTFITFDQKQAKLAKAAGLQSHLPTS